MKHFIEITNLSKDYHGAENGPSVTVFSNLCLTAEKGKSLAIVGPSGTGKSTLLNLIGGIDRPTRGEILVDGKNVSTFSEQELASYRNLSVGYIFQSHHLLPALSALENIMIPALAGHTRPNGKMLKDRANELLEEVGLAHRAHHLPDELSGGERQRVAVARALINKPHILLADEPTGALDQGNAHKLIDLLLQLNHSLKTTLLVVTHSLSLANKLDQVWAFEDGELKERNL